MLGFMEGADKRYIIPVYQRKYDWKLDNCRQLYEDLKKIVLDNRDSHFFGSIVSSVVPSGSKIEFHIIDGQQRITTVTLLLLAIRNLISQKKIQSNRGRLDEQINQRFLISPWEENEDDKIKLRPVKSDRGALAKLFDPYADYDPSSNLTLNYRYFCDQLLKGDVSVDSIYDAIGKLEIISITLDYGDNAQLIFESLNSTGLALTEGDKIRNYILMGQPPKEQTKLYDSYWTKIEECTQNDVSGFVRDYLSVKTLVTPTISNVYKDFKQYAESLGLPMENLMEDLRRYARFYEKLLTCKSGLGNQRIDDCLYRMMRLEIVVTRPFLMEVFRLNQDGKISTDDVLKVLQITENYLFRRNICDVPTNALNKIFLNLNREIIRFSNNADDYVQKCIYALLSKKESGRFPDDEEFADALATKQVYQMRGRYKAYLFERFENYGTIETKDVYTHLDNNIYTIEHIMPQHLTPAWNEALGENAAEIHETWLHRLANLTLTGYNPNLSNKPFQEKRDAEEGGYRVSGLKMNQKIALKETWGLPELEERNEEMISLAMKIWPCPETTFVPAEKSFDSCTLDDENVELTGREIAKYSYLNSEQPVSSWADMFEHVVTYLHQKDKSVLSGLAFSTSNDTDLANYVSSEGSNLRSALRIDESIFIERNTSTVLKLSILRRLFALYGADPMDLVFYLKDDGPEDVEEEKLRYSLRRRYWEYSIPKIQTGHKEAFSKAKPNKWSYIDGFFNCANIHVYCSINLKPKEAAVGMWMDCGVMETNKALFDFLYERRSEIEQKVSCKIDWDRNDGHRASKMRCVLSGCDVSKEQDWPAICEFHARVSKELAESVFYAYEDEIRSRFEKRSKVAEPVSTGFVAGSWVIPCNPDIYDVVGSFNEFDTIEWSQSVNVKAGDVAYIYVSGKTGSIMFKTTVVSADNYGVGSDEDLKYFKQDYEQKERRYMVLHLEEKYPETQYPYVELKEHGLNTVQGPSRMTSNLKVYLDSKIDGVGLLSSILRIEGLNPSTTKLVRHSFNDDSARQCYQKGFIEAYQSIQEKPVFHDCSHVLSFMGEGKGTTAVFLGLYEVKGEFEGDQSHRKPDGYPSPEQFINDRYWYDLVKSDEMSKFEGKLKIDWGKAAISWYQNATNDKVILECPGFPET